MLNNISAAFAGTVAEHAYVTTYCCSERSRRAYCPSKSWLTRTNATGRNDLQTANTLIPRKQSCSRYATIDDFSCTETQADGSNSEGIPKRDFFSFRDVAKQASKTTRRTKVSAARCGGSTAAFCLAFCLAFFFFVLNLIETLRACRTTSIEARVSSPHAAPRRSGRAWA